MCFLVNLPHDNQLKCWNGVDFWINVGISCCFLVTSGSCFSETPATKICPSWCSARPIDFLQLWSGPHLETVGEQTTKVWSLRFSEYPTPFGEAWTSRWCGPSSLGVYPRKAIWSPMVKLQHIQPKQFITKFTEDQAKQFFVHNYVREFRNLITTFGFEIHPLIVTISTEEPGATKLWKLENKRSRRYNMEENDWNIWFKWNFLLSIFKIDAN